MLEAQGGVCAICKRPPGDTFSRVKNFVIPELLQVDHDHVTGLIRGLLCKQCNLVLGCSKERVETLRASIEYLADPPRPLGDRLVPGAGR
jgi:hypothetical protein